MKRKVGSIGVIMLVVGLVGLVGLVLAGFLYGGIKSPSQSVAIVSRVCTNDVEAFNKSKGIGTDAQKLITAIEQRQSHQSDATCAYMRSYYYMTANNKERAQAAVGDLERLSDSGVFPSNKINFITPVSQLKKIISTMNSNATSDGGGG